MIDVQLLEQHDDEGAITTGQGSEPRSSSSCTRWPRGPHEISAAAARENSSSTYLMTDTVGSKPTGPELSSSQGPMTSGSQENRHGRKRRELLIYLGAHGRPTSLRPSTTSSTYVQKDGHDVDSTREGGSHKRSERSFQVLSPRAARAPTSSSRNFPDELLPAARLARRSDPGARSSTYRTCPTFRP